MEQSTFDLVEVAKGPSGLAEMAKDTGADVKGLMESLAPMSQDPDLFWVLPRSTRLPEDEIIGGCSGRVAMLALGEPYTSAVLVAKTKDGKTYVHKEWVKFEYGTQVALHNIGSALRKASFGSCGCGPACKCGGDGCRCHGPAGRA